QGSLGMGRATRLLWTDESPHIQYRHLRWELPAVTDRLPRRPARCPFLSNCRSNSNYCQTEKLRCKSLITRELTVDEIRTRRQLCPFSIYRDRVLSIEIVVTRLPEHISDAKAVQPETYSAPGLAVFLARSARSKGLQCHRTCYCPCVTLFSERTALTNPN